MRVHVTGMIRPSGFLWLAAATCCIAACADDANEIDAVDATGAAQAPEPPASLDVGVGVDASSVTLRVNVQPVTRAEDAMPGIFIPPFQECREPLPGDVGNGPDGQVCTQVAISGCTEPGKYFPNYGDCNVVRTQRPYWPAPPANEPKSDDPRLNDAEFMSELEWMTEQVAASGCTCCHDSRVGDGTAGQWDIHRGPIWLDTLSDPGLALFAGMADSSSLGAYPAEENHGFDRMATGVPTTDTARMKAFLARELERRGISEEEARAVPPFGGPIYANRVAKPGQCSDLGFGVDPELRVQFGPGGARYVYVLAEGSSNPGVPPNLDRPEGTLWRLDVPPSAAGVASGFRYGTTPADTYQTIPERGTAPALERGKRYQLYVLRDVGIPVANCVFEFGAPVVPPPAAGPAKPTMPTMPPMPTDAPAADSCDLQGGDALGFGASCTADADCTCAASYCALMPGSTQGVCTKSGCKEDASVCPADYRCFDLSQFSPGLPSICTK